MRAGVSKDSNVRTKRISSTEPAVGINNRNVTRRKVCQVLPPDIIADSSRDGSIDLKAATIMRKANGTCPTECTQIIPGKEKTLKGADSKPKILFNHALTYPNFGLRRKIHAMDSKTPGRISGTTAMGTKSARSGVFVRSVSHARTVPRMKLSAAAPEANIKEFLNVE